MLWKLAAGAGSLALAAFLVWIFGNARYHAGELAERVKWQDVRIEAAGAQADQRAAFERGRTLAAENYARTIASIEPIIVRSTDKVTNYALSPAGRVQCLDADRVRDIQAAAAALGFDSAAAGGSDRALPANDTADPARRVNEQR